MYVSLVILVGATCFFPIMDHSLVVAKGLVQLSEVISCAVQGHPRQTGHSEESAGGGSICQSL